MRVPAEEKLQFLVDPEKNLQWNKATWDGDDKWTNVYKYGYYWPGGSNQKNNIVTAIAEKFLHPHLNGRRDLKVLELAPGGGRFTTELVRLSRELHLVDYNESCIKICRERFKFYPDVMYYVNDGMSLNVVPDSDFDLIASWDSMVHIAGSIIEKYVADFASKLAKGGVIWLDHSGRGLNAEGGRSDMTKERMAAIAEQHGLFVAAQYFRSQRDCITVLYKQ